MFFDSVLLEYFRGFPLRPRSKQGICAILFLKLTLTFIDRLFLWIELIHRGIQKDVQEAPRAPHKIIAEN